MCEPISFIQDDKGNIYHCHPVLWPTQEFHGVMAYAAESNDPDSHTAVFN